MPPGVGTTGLGQAVGTIQINLKGLSNATSMAKSLGLTLSGSMSNAAKSINEAMQTQQAQTGVMRAQLAVINATIQANKQLNGGNGNGNLQQQANTLKQNIANNQLLTAQAKQQLVIEQQRTDQVKNSSQSYIQLASAMLALGAVGARITNTGVSSAGYLEQQQVMFTAMMGSAEAGNKQLEHMRDLSLQLRVPFNDLVEASRLLLPSMEGQTKQLDAQLDIIRRVATLNPVQGIQGAGFAVNEALITGGTDLKSLANRFNLPRAIFHEELIKSKHDFWVALDATLNRMKVTKSLADQMGQTFVASFAVAKDATIQLLAAGFEPLIQRVTSNLDMFTKWVTHLRQTHAEAVGVGAAIVGIVAVSVPVTFFISKWASALKSILPIVKDIALAIKGAVFSAGGLYTIAAVGGAYVGKAIGNQINSARGEKQVDWGDMWNNLKMGVFILVSVLVSAGAQVVQAVGSYVAATYRAASGLMYLYGTLQSLIGIDSSKAIKGSTDYGTKADTITASISDESVSKVIRGMLGSVKDSMSFAKPGYGLQGDTDRYPAPAVGGRKTKLSNDDEDLIYKHYKEIDKLDAHFGQERVRATEDYESQRTDTIITHEKDILRQEEDFNRQRARELTDYQEQIAKINRDEQLQEIEWNNSLAESIAKSTADSNKKIAEDEKQFQKDKERSAKEHGLRLLQAAANLDARAVWEENKTYQLSQQSAKEAHTESINKEKEQLQQKINDEIEANQKQIDNARKAMELRLADMAIENKKRLAIEDEDKRIKDARNTADFAEQLDKMDVENSKKLALMTQQYIEEKAALEESLRQSLADGGLFGDTWLKNQDAWQAEAIKRFYLFGKDIVNGMTPFGMPIEGPQEGPPKPKDPVYIQPWASGGYVGKEGLAYLHQGEQVVTAEKMKAKSMGAVFNAGAIQVNASAGMDEKRLAQLVVREMTLALESMG